MGDSGFEPLTSFASRQYNSLLEVSGACKIPANCCTSVLTQCSAFQEIWSGCCTDIGIKEASETQNTWSTSRSCARHLPRRRDYSVGLLGCRRDRGVEQRQCDVRQMPGPLLQSVGLRTSASSRSQIGRTESKRLICSQLYSRYTLTKPCQEEKCATRRDAHRATSGLVGRRSAQPESLRCLRRPL